MTVLRGRPVVEMVSGVACRMMSMVQVLRWFVQSVMVEEGVERGGPCRLWSVLVVWLGLLVAEVLVKQLLTFGCLPCDGVSGSHVLVDRLARVKNGRLLICCSQNP